MSYEVIADGINTLSSRAKVEAIGLTCSKLYGDGGIFGNVTLVINCGSVPIVISTLLPNTKSVGDKECVCSGFGCGELIVVLPTIGIGYGNVKCCITLNLFTLNNNGYALGDTTAGQSDHIGTCNSGIELNGLANESCSHAFLVNCNSYVLKETDKCACRATYVEYREISSVGAELNCNGCSFLGMLCILINSYVVRNVHICGSHIDSCLLALSLSYNEGIGICLSSILHFDGLSSLIVGVIMLFGICERVGVAIANDLERGKHVCFVISKFNLNLVVVNTVVLALCGICVDNENTVGELNGFVFGVDRFCIIGNLISRILVGICKLIEHAEDVLCTVSVCKSGYRIVVANKAVYVCHGRLCIGNCAVYLFNADRGYFFTVKL